jgi:uncharacterized OsmC-like protein
MPNQPPLAASTTGSVERSNESALRPRVQPAIIGRTGRRGALAGNVAPDPTRHDPIGEAVQRLEAALARRADFGHSTSRSVTTVVDGLRCRTEEGPWRIETDLPAVLGGGDAASTPSVLARAALGSCMAMMYVLRAARHGVELTSVTVQIETDSEIAGMLVCGTPSPAGFREIRCHVEVESPADEASVRRILDEADSLSPVLDMFGRANAVRRTTSIRPVGS